MRVLQKKLKELGVSVMENVRAVVWGRFFSTSLQVQTSTLEALCSIFQRINTMESDMLNLRQKVEDNHLILLEKLESLQQEISTRPVLSSKDDQ